MGINDRNSNSAKIGFFIKKPPFDKIIRQWEENAFN